MQPREIYIMKKITSIIVAFMLLCALPIANVTAAEEIDLAMKIEAGDGSYLYLILPVNIGV